MKNADQKKQLVCIGGGTGIHPVIVAATAHTAAITTIVAVTDSGGSTGRLRAEFNIPAMGDLRQSITGLIGKKKNPLLEKLLEYRFKQGEGLIGHSVGNLLLTALLDLTGSMTTAVATCIELLGLEGTVLPVSNQSAQLKISYTDGTIALGEHHLDQAGSNPKVIASVDFVPALTATPESIAAITHATTICIGPGDLPDSILAVLRVDGIAQALRNTPAKIIYILNLMTSAARTPGWTAQTHVAAIEQAIGRKIEYGIINTEDIPPAILQAYAAQNAYPVVDDCGDDTRFIRASLLSTQAYIQDPADTVKRSVLRHDSTKLAAVLEKII
ncbi:uridine diphosphate-N-acetylglucosamine-binding protein YvcK [Candidatus Woesebacteria bacterium]|nr:uridine diphosphate-N-acetylglucosamine-binding protein YvcK [Candidatus Woesebacteria bacterium]